MTITAEKRSAHRERYQRKDARTKVYRAVYGEPVKPDPQGDPAQNQTRKLPQGWSHAQAVDTFFALAAHTVAGQPVSNGLFPAARYAQLAHRLDILQKAVRS